jgi:hypothetical protein
MAARAPRRKAGDYTVGDCLAYLLTHAEDASSFSFSRPAHNALLEKALDSAELAEPRAAEAMFAYLTAFGAETSDALLAVRACNQR